MPLAKAGRLLIVVNFLSMNIFLSWSGEASRRVAEALHAWLPLVLGDIQPWLSGRDIRPGELWSRQIRRHLAHADFGILCLTPDNLAAPWIHYEAGELARKLDGSGVCPLMCGVDFAQLSGPLSQFQAITMSERSVLDLLHAINERSSNPLSRDTVESNHEKYWRGLEGALHAAVSETLPLASTFDSSESLASPAPGGSYPEESSSRSDEGMERKEGEPSNLKPRGQAARKYGRWRRTQLAAAAALVATVAFVGPLSSPPEPLQPTQVASKSLVFDRCDLSSFGNCTDSLQPFSSTR